MCHGLQASESSSQPTRGRNCGSTGPSGWEALKCVLLSSEVPSTLSPGCPLGAAHDRGNPGSPPQSLSGFLGSPPNTRLALHAVLCLSLEEASRRRCPSQEKHFTSESRKLPSTHLKGGCGTGLARGHFLLYLL